MFGVQPAASPCRDDEAVAETFPGSLAQCAHVYVGVPWWAGGRANRGTAIVNDARSRALDFFNADPPSAGGFELETPGVKIVGLILSCLAAAGPRQFSLIPGEVLEHHGRRQAVLNERWVALAEVTFFGIEQFDFV